MAKRMQIELNGKSYELFAGFAFLKELNDKYAGEGLATAIGGFIDSDIFVIKDALMAALNTHTGIKELDVEKFLETTDLEKLKSDFFDFLRKENCTKSASDNLILLLELYAKEASKREEEQRMKLVQEMLKNSNEDLKEAATTLTLVDAT